MVQVCKVLENEPSESLRKGSQQGQHPKLIKSSQKHKSHETEAKLNKELSVTYKVR